MIKNIIFFIEFLLIRMLFIVLNLLPLRISSKFVGIIFKFFGQLSKNHQIALKNCKYVFPKLPDKEIKNIVLKSWENLGKTVLELGMLKKIFNYKMIETNGMDNINSIIEKKIPAIYFSIHNANWEICVNFLDRMGIIVGAIYLDGGYGNAEKFIHRTLCLAEKLSNENFYSFPTCSIVKINFNINVWENIKIGQLEYFFFPELFKKNT